MRRWAIDAAVTAATIIGEPLCFVRVPNRRRGRSSQHLRYVLRKAGLPHIVRKLRDGDFAVFERVD